MTNNKTQEQKQTMLKWLNKNRRMLLELYPDQYVAYNENGIIGHSNNLNEILKIVEEARLKDHYSIYVVPRGNPNLQILSIRLRSIISHDWQPTYSVKLKNKAQEIETSMLVDSGADITLISFKVGQDLGFSLAESEGKRSAETVGGKVEYVLREIEMTIDQHSFIATVAWLQNPIDVEQLLLGREMVFDKFNIEFRQADEQIIFTWREDNLAH
jgi:hypothetical protein